MNQQNSKELKRAIRNFVIVAVVTLGMAAGAQAMMRGRGVKRPAETEFGLGPRTSAAGLYTATLEVTEPLRTRKLQTVQVIVRDASGAQVDGASITIDGGMPQHGHGLPTTPAVTQSLGDGIYVIEGLRFNMGGWWEVRLAIDAAAGPDQVTFNLSL